MSEIKEDTSILQLCVESFLITESGSSVENYARSTLEAIYEQAEKRFLDAPPPVYFPGTVPYEATNERVD